MKEWKFAKLFKTAIFGRKSNFNTIWYIKSPPLLLRRALECIGNKKLFSYVFLAIADVEAATHRLYPHA